MTNKSSSNKSDPLNKSDRLTKSVLQNTRVQQIPIEIPKLPNPDDLLPGATIGDMEVKKIRPYGPHYWHKISKKENHTSNNQTLTPLLDHPIFEGQVPTPETLVPVRDLIQISKDYFDFNGRPEWLDDIKFRKYLAKQGIKRIELDTLVPYALMMGPDVFDKFLEIGLGTSPRTPR